MKLFSRRQQSVAPSQDRLLEYGQEALAARREGRAIADPSYAWELLAPISEALRGAQREALIQEFYDTATERNDDILTFASYSAIAEIEPRLRDERFLRLFDRSLEYLRGLGLSSGHLTGFEAERWVEVHGELRSSFDGIFDVPVPSPDEAPEVEPLAPGQSRLLALTSPLPEGNAFFAEHRPDGTFVAYSERPRNTEDPTRVRCEEEELGTHQALEALMSAVGRMFGTPPYWFEASMEPYFPSRRARQ